VTTTKIGSRTATDQAKQPKKPGIFTWFSSAIAFTDARTARGFIVGRES
jgi:hypothetical protein